MKAMETKRLELPAGEFEAYLFDCDGTVADSMPLHYLAWSKALGEQRATFTEDQFYAWGGRPVAWIIERLNAEQGLRMPVEAVEARKEGLYLERLGELKAVEEVLAHVLDGYGRVKMAVVSGSVRESVEGSLRTLGLLERFDTLVCAGEYAHGKPSPEPFLLAAERLGVRPDRCLVFEDAELGIAAAKAVGMAWVRVPARR